MTHKEKEASSGILFVSPPPLQHDEVAQQEALSYAENSLDKEAKKNQHYRREKLRNHMGWAAIVFFWVLAIAVIMIGGCYLYHLLTPLKYHFLDESQVKTIQAMLFSGILVKVWPEYVKQA